MIPVRKVRLTKLADASSNTRFEEFVGAMVLEGVAPFGLPTKDQSFLIVGDVEIYKERAAFIRTSTVLETYEKDGVIYFTTLNSGYKLEVLDAPEQLDGSEVLAASPEASPEQPTV
jgi:hypothetical protein